MLVRAKARPYRMSDEGLKVRKTWLIWSTIVMLCALSLWSSHLMGQTRSALQQEYLQLLQDNPSPFGSAPITHITLQRGAFTGGVTSDIYNATIVPEGSDISESRSGQKVRMDVGGWDTSVLFAYTTANLGLGILGRGGERQVIFLDQSSLVSNGGVNYFGAASFAGGSVSGQ